MMATLDNTLQGDDWEKKLQEDLARLSTVPQGAPGTDEVIVPDMTDATTFNRGGTDEVIMPDMTDATTFTRDPQVTTAANPMSVPPPPPPPPAPPPVSPMTGSGIPQTMEMAGAEPAGDGGLSADLEAYASQWMQNPNRYLSDLVTSTREAGDMRRAEARNEGVSNIDELISSRGLVGSSVEGDIRSDLERALAADVSAEERELLNMLASYEAQDRLAGGQFGLDVAQFAQASGFAQQDIDLRAQELMQQAELEGRSLDIEEARNLATQGLAQQEIDLRAQELVQQAQLEGRALDIEEARNLASQDIAREQMEHEVKLQTNSLTQRESEFARSMGLDERQFVAQQEQFALQFGEEVAGRLQQNEQFRITLESEDARFAINTGLQERALDLQGQGMEMDDAFRTASLNQERELTMLSQELTRLGLEQEDAYRYAALSQDAHFREAANRLVEQGMDLDEAFRRAELEFREAASERADQSTRLSILVQAMNALGQWGGFSGDSQALIDMIMGGDASGSGTGDGGTTTDGSAPTSGGTAGGTAGGYGPSGDMTWSEWMEYLENNNEATNGQFVE
jgi:hypothetical protein